MKIIITENQQRKLSHIFTIGGLLEQKRVKPIKSVALKEIVQEISNDLNDLLPKIAGEEESTWKMVLTGDNPENLRLKFQGEVFSFHPTELSANRYITPVQMYQCGRKPKNYGGGAIYCSNFGWELKVPDLFNKFIAAYPKYAYLFEGKLKNDEQTNNIKNQINNIIVNIGFEPGSSASGKGAGVIFEVVDNTRRMRKEYADNKKIKVGTPFSFYDLINAGPSTKLVIPMNKKVNAFLYHVNTAKILSDVQISAPPPKIIPKPPSPVITGDTFAKEIEYKFEVTDPFEFDKPDLTPSAEDAIAKEMQEVYKLKKLGFLEDYLKTKINGKDIIVQAYSSIDAKSDELGGGGVTECKPGKVMRKDYNLCLSQKRAETIVNHLNGAFSDIFGEANLIAKGMGELESPNSMHEPYYLKATAEHIKKYPELKLRLGQRFRNPPQKAHSDANRVATAADRKFVINLPGYTGVITEGAIRDIMITESQIKRLMMFQPGNEMSLNEIVPVEGIITLKKGNISDDVRAMQQELVNREYTLPRWGVDGRFGPETERAVKSFQKDHGLTVDGVVTTEVLTAMKDTENVNPNPTAGGSYQSGAKSNEQAPISDNLIIEIVNGTISAGGSKNYTDLFLDSNSDTAVGILHFTKRGLKKLYKEMDTEKYFGKSENEMIATIKTYNGDEMKHSDWKNGMLRFLNSPESESVQNRAASRKFKEGLVTPIRQGGWNTPREYAVGMFYLNSYPKCLYQMGPKYGWDAEQMLRAYCSGECSAVSACRSRCNHINDSYPISANAGGYVYKGC